MFREEKLELKVGLFIGIGIFLMFMIVFSVSDIYFWEKGYSIRIIFDYINGVTKSAPIRLAGVHVGEVQDIKIFYDELLHKTRVGVEVWINGDVRIEKDAIVRINTLGLLGEQYIEISPGTIREFLGPGDAIYGRNPVNVGVQMERMTDLIGSVADTFEHVEKGEGTLGKLLVDDSLYNDLAVVFERLRKGEGTIGKLLADEKIYNDLEDFVSDIKANPWKLLHKPRESEMRRSEKAEKKGTR